MTRPLPGYRPQCVDSAVTGEPHQIDGPHYQRCAAHQHQHTLWRKARDIYVRRQREKAEAAGQPFDRDAALRAREQQKPWRPALIGGPGKVTLHRHDVHRVRTTLGALVNAMLPVDTAHREGEDLTTNQLKGLLTAIEKHATLVTEILDRRR